LREFGLKTPEEFERLEEPKKEKIPQLNGNDESRKDGKELDGQQKEEEEIAAISEGKV